MRGFGVAQLAEVCESDKVLNHVLGANLSRTSPPEQSKFLLQHSNSAPELRRDRRSFVRLKKQAFSRRNAFSATPGSASGTNLKNGSARALQYDRMFQQELQAKWRSELEAELGPECVQKRREAPLCDFVPVHGERSSLITPWMKNAATLEAAMTNALPHFEASSFPDLPASRHHALNETLNLSTSMSHPALYGPATRFYRPAFCRLLIDSGLVQCENAGSAVPYHLAVRYFDSVALSASGAEDSHCRGLLSCLPSVDFDHIAEILHHLITSTDSPQRVQERFFQDGLDEANRVGDALLQRCKQRVKQRMLEEPTSAMSPVHKNLVSFKHRKECLSVHGAPPRIFSGSVHDWANGLDFWMSQGDTQSTARAIEKQVGMAAALDNYIIDMLIEPGVLYVAQASKSLFLKLFEVYADEERKQWDLRGRCKVAKHLSYAAFFRFCLDFCVFPSLCSFEFATQTYREAECMEELGSPPPEPDEDTASKDLGSESSQEQPSIEPGKNSRRLSHAVLQVTKDIRSLKNSSMEKRRSSFSMGSDGHPLATQDPRSPKRRNSFSGPVDPNNTKSRRNSQNIEASRKSVPTDQGRRHSTDSAVPTNQRSNSVSGVPPTRRASMGSMPDAAKQKQKLAPPDSLGNRGPSKASVESRNSGSRSPSKIKTPAPLLPAVPLKQLTPIDMSWVKMSFASMPQGKLQAYMLLKALGHCSSDSFQSVIGLFDLVLDSEDELTDGEDDVQSVPLNKDVGERVVDASDLLDCLARLNVKHAWDIEDAETFVKTLSTDPDQKGVRLLDLDKAVCRVREDMLKRFESDLLGFSSSDAFYRSSEYEYGVLDGISNPARSPLGNLALGDQARRLEKEVGWLCKSGETTESFLFGQAAFMESLLRIAFKHLHSTGVQAQSAMPGGAKAVWLMTYLHHRFECIRHGEKPNQRFSSESTRPGTEASTRPWTAESDNSLFTRPSSSATSSMRTPSSSHMSSSSFDNRPKSGVGQKDISSHPPAKLPALGASMPSSPKLIGSLSPLGKTDSAWQGCKPHEACKTPEVVTYMPKRTRATEHYPDLFEKLPWMLKSSSGAVCQSCNYSSSETGIGNMHCHMCSGIDSMHLTENPLWPLLNRRKLRREIYLAEIAEKVNRVNEEGSPREDEDEEEF